MLALGAAAMLIGGACASGGYDSAPPPAPTTTTVAPEVTVRGVVAVFSPSARILTLAQPVAGVTNVVVPTEAEIVRSTGARAGAGDLVARATVEVTGRRSNADTLVARRVVLL